MKTNPVLKETIQKLEEKSRKGDIGIWKDVAQNLKKANRKTSPVNLAKINRNSEDGDILVVPGKVTGYGNLNKDVKIAAFSFSKSAKEKIKESGEYLSIEKLLEDKPSGSDVKIIKG